MDPGRPWLLRDEVCTSYSEQSEAEIETDEIILGTGHPDTLAGNTAAIEATWNWLKVEQNAKGLEPLKDQPSNEMLKQEFLRVQDHLTLCDTYFDEVYHEDDILMLKEYAIRDFHPELRWINQAARKINFRDITYKGTTTNQALIAGDIDVLNKLRDFLTSPPGTYRVVNVLYQGLSVPTQHLQFIDMLDGPVSNEKILGELVGRELDPTPEHYYVEAQKRPERRTFDNIGHSFKYEFKDVLNWSVVVALTTLGRLDKLKLFMSMDKSFDSRDTQATISTDVSIAIIVADHLNKRDILEYILDWHFSIYKKRNACQLSHIHRYLGWKPRTNRLRNLVLQCKEPVSDGPLLAANF
ncbi:hypothetical protein IWQ60_005440 [Tieghemiomyces parasiticus]|uniref:Uncharacterized protein n=1 Tax=Tieghemiomyces parasiticus TaxID=78921 RepID=A0A9W8DYV7_9FUNG|nr:hypothetical protein IWQ60_005440 [Tieghemiomyces parasiticus]